MLKQSDDIGERLMKRENVGVGWFLIAPVQPVEQRVRGLVRDDVMCGRAENPASRQVQSDAVLASPEVAQKECLVVRTVEGVGRAQCVRVDAKPRHVCSSTTLPVWSLT